MGNWVKTLQDYLPDIVTGDSYPVTAYIFKQREGQDRLVKDEAARVTTDDGHQRYLLKREDTETAAVPYSRIYNAETGDGQQDIVFIWSANKDQYQPFSIDAVENGLAEIDIDDAEWENFRTLEAKNTRQDWKEDGSWWEENQALIAAMGIGFMILLSMIGFGWAMDKMMGEMTAAAEQFAQAAQTLKEAQTATGG